MRQPRGTDDPTEIDLIDADPSVFGHRQSAPVAERRPLTRWLIPFAIGIVAALGATSLVWRPWEVEPKWRTFSTAPTEGEQTPLGYVFAEAGGNYQSDRWALFRSRGSNAAGEATPADATYRVKGMNATVRRVRVRTTITWGPFDGNYWDVETNLLGGDEALRFAESVGVVDGLPALERSYSLHDLRPLGDVKTLGRVQVLADYLGGEPVLSPFTPTVLTYQGDNGPLLVASIAIAADGLAMAEFYFGRSSPTTVAAEPALLIHSRLYATMVVWMGGGRLVVLSGQESDATMVELANTLREANHAQWAAVVEAAMPERHPSET